MTTDPIETGGNLYDPIGMGDAFDEREAAIACALRQICAAGLPWVGDDQLAGADHGHTDCWMLSQLVKEIYRLRTLASLSVHFASRGSVMHHSKVAGFDPATDYLRNATGAMNPAVVHPCCPHD